MNHSENKQKQTQSLKAFTLLETVVAMSLIAVVFLLVMQAFNSLILGSYLIEARTAVRNEGEFVSEYLKLRIKNADPKSIKVFKSVDGTDEITWQARGSSDSFTFFSEQNPNNPSIHRLCLDNSLNSGIACDTVLTYEDIDAKNLKIAALQYTDTATGQQFTTVDISFDIDSTLQYAHRAAVRDVSRYISVAVR